MSAQRSDSCSTTYRDRQHVYKRAETITRFWFQRESLTLISFGLSDTAASKEVAGLQTFLTSHYGMNLQDVVKGYFGKTTRGLVVRFQSEQGLDADGYVGPLTSAALMKSCGQNGTNTANSDGVYADPFNLFTIKSPSGQTLQPLSQEADHSHYATSGTMRKYPQGAVGIAGLVRFNIQTLSDAGITATKPFLEYESCCSGTRYWYDSSTMLWNGEHFQTSQYDSTGKSLPELKEALHLADKGGQCSLNHQIGKNVFAVLKAGDEGVPDEYHYMIILSAGKVLDFVSPLGLFTDFSNYGDSYRPSAQKISALNAILESVQLTGAQAVETSCK